MKNSIHRYAMLLDKIRERLLDISVKIINFCYVIICNSKFVYYTLLILIYKTLR